MHLDASVEFVQANAAGVAAVKDALQDAGVASDQAGGHVTRMTSGLPKISEVPAGAMVFQDA